MKLSILFVPLLVSGVLAVIPFTPEMGKSGFQQISPKTIQTANFDSRNYLIYKVSVGWDQGKLICQTLVPGTPLDHITFETQAEVEFINTVFYNGTAEGGEFWTSGRQDLNSPTRLAWDSNSMPVPTNASMAPWAPNEPPLLISPDTRITTLQTKTMTSTWQTRNKGEAYLPLICELTSQNEPCPCERRNDIIVVLDSSGSISPDNFRIALDFVDKLTAAILNYGDSRVALIVYSTSTHTVLRLDNGLSPEDISFMIKETAYSGGGTNTHLALDSAILQYGQLNRPGVPKNVLTITDGFSTVPLLTTQAADRAKAAGLRMLAVGVEGYNAEEILKLAGDNTDHAFTTNNFHALMNLLYPVSIRACA